MRTSSPVRASLFALLLASLAACNDSGSNDGATAATEPINKPETAPGSIDDQVAPAETINPQALQAAGHVSLAVGSSKSSGNLPEWGSVVLRTEADWPFPWSDLSVAGVGLSAPPMPKFDFSKFMVVGVIGRSSACVQYGIQRVESSATALTVHWWRGLDPSMEPVCNDPYGGKFAPQTFPPIPGVGFALVPRSSLPVQFVEHSWEGANPAWSRQLLAAAAPYENRMPQVTAAGSSPACAQLIVPFAVRGSGAGLPQSLKVNAVAVAQDGVTRWLQPASASETGITQGVITDSNWLQDVAAGTAGIRSEPVLRGVARGCTSSQFKLDQPVTVLLSVAAADGQAELVAQNTLTAAY